MSHSVSPEGRAFIENFEGLSLGAYLCPAGVWTIGYGHTRGVKQGDLLDSKQEADELLAVDLKEFGDNVGIMAGVATSKHQFDALVSLAFNIGIGGFAGSTVLRMHRAGNYNSAAYAFPLWCKATIDGQLKDVPGLVRRRAAEALVYLTSDDVPHPLPDPAPVALRSMPQAIVCAP